MAEALRIEMWLGDCLEVMPNLVKNRFCDGDVSLAISDLPFGCTHNSWDTKLDLKLLWSSILRVKTRCAAMIFFANQPIASSIVASKSDFFRYELIWQKTHPTGFLNSKYRPLSSHENILVFSESTCNPQSKFRMTYNAQKRNGKPYFRPSNSQRIGSYDIKISTSFESLNGDRHPTSVLLFKKDASRIHPTQKPVALLEWLIKTYTNPGDTVLDPCAGSFTTSVAALKTGRNSICIEKDKTYFAAGVERVKAEIAASGVNANLVVHG